MTDQESLNDLSKAVRDLSKWIKLAYREKIIGHFESILDTDEKRIAYEATDGIRSTREVGKLAGVDQKTISIWWRIWITQGIAEPGQHRAGRPQKIVSLREIGFEI